jgi:hypothetical protein
MPRLLFIVLALSIAQSRIAYGQAVGGGRAVAIIEILYADSTGQVFRGNRPVSRAALDSLLDALRPKRGATIWFSWAGGTLRRRTAAQDSLLAHVRQSAIRVELRTDSTFRAGLIRE